MKHLAIFLTGTLIGYMVIRVAHGIPRIESRAQEALMGQVVTVRVVCAWRHTHPQEKLITQFQTLATQATRAADGSILDSHGMCPECAAVEEAKLDAVAP